ncbi:MAG: molybdopterin cofactor-binding domain-containing protein, partial [Bacteroidota bacterium]
METIEKTSRRNFLKIAALSSGGLVLGFHWSDSAAATFKVVKDEAMLSEHNFNSYLSISTDDIITIFSPNPELGQNIKTSFPMIVAEELDADWSKVKVLQAALDTKKYERQLTGGSGAIPHSWERLRKAGATARHLLVEAAAKKWNVASSALVTENGRVIDKANNRSLSYGELV